MKFVHKFICKFILKKHTYHKGDCKCGAIKKVPKPVEKKKPKSVPRWSKDF